MINSYFVDKINIINTTYDTWGVETEATQSNVACRIEYNNKLIKDANGQETMSFATIFIDDSITIDYIDKIQIIEVGGKTIQGSSKKWAIKKIHLASGFTSNHYEVMI